MSTKRDTHFQNAAILLTRQLYKRFGYGIDLRDEDDKEWHTLIAQFAYDVAFHTLSDMSESDVFLFNRGERKVEEIVPDLDKLPEIPDYYW